MSDGAGEGGRGHEQKSAKRTPGSDNFSRAIAKIAVAQICESEGFQSFQQSALDTLSNVAVQYIKHLGKTAHSYTNLAGRMDCNIFDILQALEDLASLHGFSGASDVNHCLSSTNIVGEIIEYANDAGDIRFAYDISHFPVMKDRKPTPSFIQTGQEPPGHIPAWLPVFPDPKSSTCSPMWSEGRKNNHSDTVEHERRKGGRSLLNFQHRLACSGLEEPLMGDLNDVEKAKQAAETNPFLAAPLPFGQKEVSPIPIPVRITNEASSRSPVMENHVAGNLVPAPLTSCPPIRTLKNRLFDSENGEKIGLNRRPAVQFKIGMNNISPTRTMGANLHIKGVQKTACWFGEDIEKDDRKRRTEKILKKSLENSAELAQL